MLVGRLAPVYILRFLCRLASVRVRLVISAIEGVVV